MTHTPMTRRPGISLMEAMIAIGVMAIGLLSLLTLFPLGAVQIGQALKDDRCSEAALQADAYMRSYWEHAVAGGRQVQPPGTLPPENDQKLRDPDGTGPLTDYFIDPSGSGGTYTAVPTGERSYPVFVDPIGHYTYSTPYQTHVGGQGSGIPRVNLAGILPDGNTAVRVCSLTDDLTYGPDGAATLSGGQLVRQGRYTWAAMLQKPLVDADTCELKVLVFDRRIPLLNDTRNELVSGSANDFMAVNILDSPVFRSGIDRTIKISGLPASEVPILRRGGWIMDGTVDPGAGPGAIRQAEFYRITAIESPSPNNFVVDLETPIVRTGSSSGDYTPTFYILGGLAEVFDRPALTD